eukprot:8647239-Lingulodinium_polyedra.AAC.1
MCQGASACAYCQRSRSLLGPAGPGESRGIAGRARAKAARLRWRPEAEYRAAQRWSPVTRCSARSRNVSLGVLHKWQ